MFLFCNTHKECLNTIRVRLFDFCHCSRTVFSGSHHIFSQIQQEIMDYTVKKEGKCNIINLESWTCECFVILKPHWNNVFTAGGSWTRDICVYVCMWAHLRMCMYGCLLGLSVCMLQTVQGRKKAGVLKCHITQHGNYAHDMRCVSSHQHRPLSMCRTGPQPSTCAEDMHEMYTGMSLYGSLRVGNATLITFFIFIFIFWLCWVPSSLWLFLLWSVLLLFVVPAPLKRRQLHMTAALLRGSQDSVWHQREWNLFYRLCERTCEC